MNPLNSRRFLTPDPEWCHISPQITFPERKWRIPNNSMVGFTRKYPIATQYRYSRPPEGRESTQLYSSAESLSLSYWIRGTWEQRPHRGAEERQKHFTTSRVRNWTTHTLSIPVHAVLQVYSGANFDIWVATSEIYPEGVLGRKRCCSDERDPSLLLAIVVQG